MRPIHQSTILAKTLFLFLLLIASAVSLSAQNRITDSSVTCIAFWKKGEERKLKITHTKSRGTSETDMRSEDAMSYIARVTVLDSTADGYKIKWKFTQPQLQKTGVIKDGSGVPIFDGMEFIFSTNDGGMFMELENWEEVRDNYRKLFLLSAKDTTDAVFKSTMEKALAMFSTREQVENSMIKEIQIYHSVYGLEFNRAVVKTAAILPSPYVSEGLPATTEIVANLSPVSSAYLTIGMNVQLERKGTAKVLKEVFKKMGVSGNDADLNKAIESMDISEKSEYQVRLSDGWIKQAIMTRISQTGPIRQAESFLIELEDD